MIVNGFDLATLGLIVDDSPRWRDLPRHQRALVPVPGRIPLLDLGPRPIVEPRALEIIGTQRGSSVGELKERLSAMKRRLTRGELEIRLPDMTDRFYRGELDGLEVSGIRPVFTQLAHRVRIRITCRDPRAYDLAEQNVGFGAATPMPLGDAPVDPIIRINAPNNPVIVYRDSGGVERGRLELSSTGLTWVEVDTGRGTIADQSGVNRIEHLVSGELLELDPAHGSADGASHPTLEVTGGAGAARYRKAWW